MPKTALSYRRVEFHADRFVQHTAITRAIEDMNFVYELSGHNQRPVNLAISGEGGIGKTSLINYFLSTALGVDPQHSHFGFRKNISTFDLPTDVTPTKLLNAILDPANANPQKMPLGSFALKAEEMGLKLIIIDEFHELARVPKNYRNQCLHLIKWIGNNLKIPFIVAGTADIERVFKSDNQLGRRFKVLTMKRWEPGREFEYFIYSYLKSLPGFEELETLSKELFDLLLHGQSNTTFDIKTTLGEAAYQAYCHQDISNIHVYARKIAMTTGHYVNG